jgi:very-short-patch-repair endonuclease
MIMRIISYPWGLVAKARERRQPVTEAQARLWAELKGRRMLSFRFVRQHSIDRYRVDFYCADLSLAIEVDALNRDDAVVYQYDRERDVRLRLCGVAVLRFTEEEVLNNLDGVLTKVRQSLRYLPWRKVQR